MTVRLIALLGLAGACGVLARFGITKALTSEGMTFPWGTVAVNLLGCFLYGLFVAVVHEHLQLHKNHEIAIIALTGFLGALTTFSTYAFDMYVFFEQKAWWPLAGYAVLQNGGGLLLLLAGIWIGRLSAT